MAVFLAVRRLTRYGGCKQLSERERPGLARSTFLDRYSSTIQYVYHRKF